MRALLLIALALFAANAEARPPRPGNDFIAVDRACRAAMYYGSDAQKCVQLASRARYYDSDVLACIGQ
jgi:hypothetical protein